VPRKVLDFRADPNTIFRSKPLIIEYLSNGLFVENYPSETALLQLVQKANIDVMGPAGNYPLHLTLGRIKMLDMGHWRSRLHPGFYAITAALNSRNARVNQTNDVGASPLEIWLRKGMYKRSRIVKVALLLFEAGADTMMPTSTRETLFDLLNWLPSDDQNLLTKAFLKRGAVAQENANSRLHFGIPWAGFLTNRPTYWEPIHWVGK
jgi:hypothetical protein